MIMYGYRYEKIAVGHYWDPKRSDYIWSEMPDLTGRDPLSKCHPIY